MADAYDERPYTQHAYAETHPSRVAAVARMSEWEPPGLQGARVLELGCGRGGNLLPMAVGLPEATFVGVDRSAAQIADARAVAAGAGLTNVTFVAATFGEFDPAPGVFDYVVCHGVLSWIAPGDRVRLLETMARALAPAGVAHVSYNVLPGWYDRLAARDWLRFAASSLGVAAERAAESVEWLSGQVTRELPDYRRRLGQVAQRLRETEPAYAEHEYLAPEHHPQLVSALFGEAGAAGLAYLGDAIPATTALELLPEEVRRRAADLGAAQAQQVVDFVRCTGFRRSLLVRSDEARRRSWHLPLEMDRSAVRSLWIASRLRSREPRAPARPLEAFDSGAQIVQVSDAAARCALHELSEAAPAALSFDALSARVAAAMAPAAPVPRALSSELFDLWLATGAIDFLSAPPALSAAAGERPIACPLARWQAAHDGLITNRLHEEVLVPDAIVRWVLARLDGTRTRRDLAQEACFFEGAARANAGEREQLVAASVDRIAACALLVGSG